MSRQPSIIFEACLRFDGLKAIGVSRYHLRRHMRADAARRGVRLSPLAISTGRIHADKTLDTYKGIALRYVHWARGLYGIRRLADLDGDAERLVALYLVARRDAGDSPYTLKTTRAALRMFHRPAYAPEEREERVRALGASVDLPLRRRAAITRSRAAVAMDDEIVLDRYVDIVTFCCATGLRRRELEVLVVGDIGEDAAGGPVVLVCNGKGGKHRVVPVLPSYQENVLRAVAPRLPEDLLFPRIPVRLDIHAYRRAYAQALYREGDTRLLPPREGRLPHGSVDQERALYVSRALGHERIDVVVRHYLR